MLSTEMHVVDGACQLRMVQIILNKNAIEKLSGSSIKCWLAEVMLGVAAVVCSGLLQEEDHLSKGAYKQEMEMSTAML